MSTLLSDVNLSEWTTSAKLETSKRGQKSTQISFRGGPPPFVQLTTPDAPMHAPFGASAFQDPDATRLTWQLQVTSEQADKLEEINKWAKAAADKLGCKGEWKGLLTEGKNGMMYVKMKVNTMGYNVSRIYDAQRERLQWTEDLGGQLRNAYARPVLSIAKIWCSGQMYGVTAELIQAVVELEANSECPEDL